MTIPVSAASVRRSRDVLVNATLFAQDDLIVRGALSLASTTCTGMVSPTLRFLAKPLLRRSSGLAHAVGRHNGLFESRSSPASGLSS